MEEGIHYTIDENIMTEVSDQKEQGCCLAFVLADVVSMVMRISLSDRTALASAQPLIDYNAPSVSKLNRMVSSLGLESEESYPLTRVNRDWDEGLYLIRKHKRYKIDNLQQINDPVEMRTAIIDNFKAGGKRYPILCSIDMNDFASSQTALECISTLEPYSGGNLHHSRHASSKKHKEPDHALLIYGCNTMSEDPDHHYLYVKNSHGTGWGMDGKSLITFSVLNYILVPEYEPLKEQQEDEEDAPMEEGEKREKKVTMVYVALPLKTINTECKIEDPVALDKTLQEVKEANADGVMIKVAWGIVQGGKSTEYNWDGYMKMFEKLRKEKLKIQVVICFHAVTEDDFTIELPTWIVKAGKTNSDIYFKDRQNNYTTECLSWGIDNEHVLENQTALMVYDALLRSFQETFKKFIKDKVIMVVELGLGPQGELRHPSFCADRGWKYPGIGAFQCYDKYMRDCLEKDAREQHFRLYTSPPEIECAYNAFPASDAFFRSKENFDSFESCYFLNWYAKQLVNHGHRVLSLARRIFGKKMAMNVKLTGIDWWYKHESQSHAAEVTAGFFTTCEHDGYEPVLKMLKNYNVGLNLQ
ncbi:putative beta-amylase [Helianthus debilis subsp. tardiflorus]